MSTTAMNIRVDNEAKAAASAILGQIGLPLGTAINIFLKKVVECGGMPFDLRLNSNPLSVSQPLTLEQVCSSSQVDPLARARSFKAVHNLADMGLPLDGEEAGRFLADDRSRTPDWLKEEVGL